MIQQPTTFGVHFGCGLAQQQPPSQGAAVRTGVVSFFKSIHPGYVSDSSGGQMEHSGFCADSSDRQDRSPAQRAELAARVICAYAGLPPGVVSFVDTLANISAVARWVSDKCTEPVVGNGHEEHSAVGRKQRKKQHLGTTCGRPVQLPKAAVALGALSCLDAVGAREQHWIEVDDVGVLSKIGRDPAYPLDGRYRQMADINAGSLTRPIGNESRPFVGEYDGRCKVIRELGHCFVQKLDGNGRLYDLIFFNANVVSGKPAGVVACRVSGRAALERILVDKGNVTTTGRNAPAGLAAGVAGNGTGIDGFKVVGPAMVKTEGTNSHAGLVVGEAHGIVNNSWSVDGEVVTNQKLSQAGSVAGVASGVINNTMNIRTRVMTISKEASAGGGAGHALAGAVIDNTVLLSGILATDGRESCVGGGAGRVEKGATVTNTLLVNTSLGTFGSEADAGAGAGCLYGVVTRTTMVDGRVSAFEGAGADAAVGAGQVHPSGRVSKTTSRNVAIKAWGDHSGAGVGAGKTEGTVRQTLCFESKISAKGRFAGAAVGAGLITTGIGSVDEVVSRSCNISTSHDISRAGFGAGTDVAAARQVMVVYSTAGGGQIGGNISGFDPFSFACGTSFGVYEAPPCCDKYTNSSCLHIPDALCNYSDQRVLTAQCNPLPLSFVNSGKVEGLVCPSVMEPIGSVAALSAWSMTGIGAGAIGVTGLLGVGGYCLYRRYCHSDTGQQEETAPDGK